MARISEAELHRFAFQEPTMGENDTRFIPPDGWPTGARLKNGQALDPWSFETGTWQRHFTDGRHIASVCRSITPDGEKIVHWWVRQDWAGGPKTLIEGNMADAPSAVREAKARVDEEIAKMLQKLGVLPRARRRVVEPRYF